MSRSKTALPSLNRMIWGDSCEFFPIAHAIPSDRVTDLYATSSDIASLPPDARGELLARIADLAADLPETLELRERSDVMLSFRT